MLPLRSLAVLTLLFSLASAQSYDYYYYPTWPIYTAVILVFSIIVSIIGACCRRRAILQRQQRLQAAVVTGQAVGPYPPGTYPVTHYPPGVYPPPPTGPYAGGFVPGGPATNLPPYSGVSTVATAEGYSNMGFAQGQGAEDLYKPPPYSPPGQGYSDPSKPSAADGYTNDYSAASRGDAPPPSYGQAAGYSASTSTAAPSFVGVSAPQQPQQHQ